MTVQHTDSGAGAPVLAPPSIGAHYTDTSTGDQYLGKGTTSAADWVLQEQGGAAVAAVQAHEGASDPHPQYATAAEAAAAAPVQSVNGSAGAVVLDAAAVGAEPAGALAAHAGSADPHPNYTTAAEAAAAAPVQSVNGQTGAVTLDAAAVGAEASGALAAHAAAADPHTVYQKKEAGKGLSANDYTTAEKSKLASFPAKTIVTVDADITLSSASHNGAHIVADASVDVVLTVPSGDFSAGAEIAVEKVGSGKVEIRAGSGAALRFPASLDPWLAEKYGVARLKAVTASIWSLSGDLADHIPARWMVVGGGYTNGITIFNTSTMERIAPSLALTNSYGKPAFSPDRTLLAVGYSASPWLVMFDTETWQQKYDGPTLPSGNVKDLQFSPDGQYLAAAHYSSPYLTIWRTSDWTLVTLPAGAVTSNAEQVAWSPDSTKLVVAGPLPYMKTMDTATWQLTTGPVNTSYAVYQMDFSPDGQYLATMQTAGDEFVIYRTSDWTKLANLPSRPSLSNPSHFFWSPDSSKFVAAGGLDPYIAVYETTTWTKISSFPVAITRTPNKVCVDNETLFSFYNSTPRMVRHKLSDWTELPDISVPFTFSVEDVEISQAI